MAAGSAARIIRAPGRIIINPTEEFKSFTYPYGGTEIGKTNLCALNPLGVPFRVESEALGESIDVLEPNKNFVFGCVVRGWDDDAINQLFSTISYSAGDPSQHAVYSEPGSKIPGTTALGRAVIMAYVPDDPIHVPGLLIYSGVAEWSEGSELAFQRGTELGLPITVTCMRDTNGNILRMGRLSDLSLT